MTETEPRPAARIASWPGGHLRDQAQQDNTRPDSPRRGEILREIGTLLGLGLAPALIGWGLFTLAELAHPGAGLPMIALTAGVILLRLTCRAIASDS